MAKRKKISAAFIIIFALFFGACVAITLSSYNLLPKGIPTWDDILGRRVKTVQSVVTDGSDAVHFVDCWQGDCSVITSGGSVTVIDAGPAKYQNDVISYLKAQGIKKIDNLVLTHPHEDHIGGASALISEFDVCKIYMKKPAEGKEPTSSTYQKLLEKIAEKQLKITDLSVGSTITSGNFSLKVLGPLDDYDDYNENSIVLKAVYNDISFLFMGDAEKNSEADLLEKYGSQLSADVLKVGHHGSSTSSKSKFIKAVAPKYGVILCGEDNSYDHPSGTTLKTLEQAGVTVYRTDLNGNIVFKTDGKKIEIITEKSS